MGRNAPRAPRAHAEAQGGHLTLTRQTPPLISCPVDMLYTYHRALTGTPGRSREGDGGLRSELISEGQDGLQLIRLVDDEHHGQVNLRLIDGCQ